MADKLQPSAIVLTEKTSGADAKKMTELILQGLLRMEHLMRGPVPLSMILTETMRDALEKGDPVVELLLGDAEQRFIFAADKEAEKLLDQIQPMLEERGLMNESLVIFRKIDAIQAYCERRGLKRFPSGQNPVDIYAVECVRILSNFLRSQYRI